MNWREWHNDLGLGVRIAVGGSRSSRTGRIRGHLGLHRAGDDGQFAVGDATPDHGNVSTVSQRYF